jgi:hypothetical protein
LFVPAGRTSTLPLVLFKLTYNRIIGKMTVPKRERVQVSDLPIYMSVRFVLANGLFLIAHFHKVIIGARAVRRDGGLQLLGPQDVRLQAHEGWGARHRLSLTGAGYNGAAPCSSSSANRYCASCRPPPQSDMVRYPVTRAPGSCVVRLEVRL